MAAHCTWNGQDGADDYESITYPNCGRLDHKVVHRNCANSEVNTKDEVCARKWLKGCFAKKEPLLNLMA